MTNLDYILGAGLPDDVKEQADDLFDALYRLNREHGGDEYPYKPLTGDNVTVKVETLNRLLDAYRKLIA